MEPFAGIDSGVFGNQGVGYHHPNWDKIGVCSQKPINWKHWSGPGRSLGALASPQGAEERTPETGGTDCRRAGVCFTAREAQSSRDTELWHLGLCHVRVKWDIL